MTEAEWLTSSDPAAMLRLVTENPDHANIVCNRSDRKLRLFACACHRREPFWTRLEPRSRFIVMAVEGFADGKFSSLPPVEDIVCLPDAVQAAQQSIFHAIHEGPTTIVQQAALIRDIFGNPFRPQSLPLSWICVKCEGDGYLVRNNGERFDCRACGGKGKDCPWLTWNDGIVPKLAQAIYDERAFDRMPILADALEEAGCTNEDILNHCRGMQRCHNCVSINAVCDVCQLTGFPGWFPSDPDNTHFPFGPHMRGCWVIDLLLGKG